MISWKLKEEIVFFVTSELPKIKTERSTVDFFFKKRWNGRKSWTNSKMAWKFGYTGFSGATHQLETFLTTSDKQECQIPEQGCQVLNFFVSLAEISKVTFFIVLVYIFPNYYHIMIFFTNCLFQKNLTGGYFFY